jgi:hypothetical protein
MARISVRSGSLGRSLDLETTGVRYSTFLLDDRLTLVNLVAIVSEAGLGPLASCRVPTDPGGTHQRSTRRR